MSKRVVKMKDYRKLAERRKQLKKREMKLIRYLMKLAKED